MSDLTAFRDYARRRADDPAATKREFELWTQLADEIDAHLGRDEAEPDLFDLNQGSST